MPALSSIKKKKTCRQTPFESSDTSSSNLVSVSWEQLEHASLSKFGKVQKKVHFESCTIVFVNPAISVCPNFLSELLSLANIYYVILSCIE